MILIVAPTPSYQRIWTFSKLKLDQVNRAESIDTLASGKGVNCARAIRKLGGMAEVLTFLGGETGRWMGKQLKAEGISVHAIEVDAPTRNCNTLVDKSTGHVTELVENAFPLSVAAEQKFRQKFEQLLPSIQFVICIGTIPEGVSSALYRDVIRMTHKCGLPAIVDAQGEALRLALEAQPQAVKVNHRELAEALHMDGPPEEVMKAMLQKGCPSTLMTQGPDPAWLAVGEKIQEIPLPGTVRGNTIGAGDSVSAGLALGLLAKQSMEEATRYALACGMATVGYGYGRVHSPSVPHWAAKIQAG